jgi:hypothetical protein
MLRWTLPAGEVSVDERHRDCPSPAADATRFTDRCRDGEREIVRQQFTFSPPDTSVECEEHAVNLDGVTRLELIIVPAIDDGHRVATPTEWRTA